MSFKKKKGGKEMVREKVLLLDKEKGEERLVNLPQPSASVGMNGKESAG